MPSLSAKITMLALGGIGLGSLSQLSNKSESADRIANSQVPVTRIDEERVPPIPRAETLVAIKDDGTPVAPVNPGREKKLEIDIRGKFSELQKEAKAYDEAHFKKLSPLMSKADKDIKVANQVTEMFKAFDADKVKRCEKAFELVKTSQSPFLQIEAEVLSWVMLQRPFNNNDIVVKAIEIASKNHLASTDPTIGKFVNSLLYVDSKGDVKEKIEKFLAEMTNNKKAEIRGQVKVVQASFAQRAYQDAESNGSDNLEELANLAIRAFKVLQTSEYSEVPYLVEHDTTTLGKFANKQIYNLQNLRVGKLAPDFEGERLAEDGKKMRLSNYRGKVTVIDFWASWCGPCLAKVPKMRQIEAKFRNRPLAIVGVNCDEDRASGVKAAARTKMGWPSFWNESSATPFGKIVDQYDIQMWPTVIVIDHKGIIRAKYTDGRKLEDISKFTVQLSNLVAEAEVDAGAKGGK